MGLFRAKKKEIDYETEASLPEFFIDVNGYVIFRNNLLGGVSVMEIVPHIATESITREDSVFHNDSCDLSENPGYDPLTNALFADARGRVFPPWVYFLNSLQQQDESDEPTHVQILAKKCRTAEWNTRIEYAIQKGYDEFNDRLLDYQGSMNKHDVLLGARAADYLSLLEDVQHSIEDVPSGVFDIRRLPAYKTRFFLVVSYTPSSEGWWLDGRDTDYYITDNNIVDSIILGNEEKLIPKLTDMLTSKTRRQEERETGGQEEDFFWIESDRTAQILHTRTKKIEQSIMEWNKLNPNMKMPFHVKHLEEREVAALIAFFPNIMTPYWDKIWELQSDQNDLLYNRDVRVAVQTGDKSIVSQKELVKAIADGKVDMRSSKQEREKFLDTYKNKNYKELSTLSDEHADKTWTPQKEEEMEARKRAAALSSSKNDDLWGDFDSSFAVEDEFKTDAQKREEFLKRYKNRSRK